MKTLYNILIGISAGVVAGILIYIFSKIQMKGWLKAIEEHFQEIYSKTKTEEK
jgi:hypothetical protein